ncbi:hypothetical protein IMZ48_06135, partial [Candidatus Bathyarchaeota archaeon]|nr:hypothetical protein [Candidatus Bathyarchaeota archaeon]
MEERNYGPAMHDEAHDEAHGLNDLAIKAPSDDHRLPSPSPTPTPQEPRSRAPSVNSVKSNLPTIHSDEDEASSSASSSRTRLEHHDTPESPSTSEGSPPPQTTDPEIKNPSKGEGERPRTATPESVRRLSATGMQHLTASRHSLPIAVVPDAVSERNGRLSHLDLQAIRTSILHAPEMHPRHGSEGGSTPKTAHGRGHPRTLSTPPMRRSRRSSALTSPRRNSFNPLPTPNLRPHDNTPADHLDDRLPAIPI